MLVLLDNNVPRGVGRALTNHTVTEARERGWGTLRNGDLLRCAEESGFDVMITSDKNLRYQQNLAGRKIALVILSELRWRFVRPRLDEISVAVNQAQPGTFIEVQIPIVG